MEAAQKNSTKKDKLTSKGTTMIKNITKHIVNLKDTNKEQRIKLSQILEYHDQPLYSKANLQRSSFRYDTYSYDKLANNWAGSNETEPTITIDDFIAKYKKPSINLHLRPLTS